jgi:Protein of unknown function (DUF1638)
MVACGALARELRVVLTQLELGDVDVEYLPAPLHNRPQLIPGRVDEVLTAKAADYDRVIVGYGDCGTGGLLEPVLARHGAKRLAGDHCYEFLAGSAVFAELHDAEPGTFYLTDYLALHFDALVWAGLGLDRHPRLRDAYFGNYVRVVLLSQSSDERVLAAATAAAERLQLSFVHRHVGLEPVKLAIRNAA